MRVRYKMEAGAPLAVLDEYRGDATPGRIPCYAHIGQHGEGDARYLARLRTATDAEAEPLKRELRAIGYPV